VETVAKKTSEFNPVKSLTKTLKADMDQVNEIILKEMRSDVALIPELAGYLIASGGKRIRPLLTLASAALFGYQGIRAQRLAACIEFIHTATLLHDDVVDESAQRRGKDSANEVFGNQASVLVGDFLFSRAFQLMVQDGSLDVLRILSTASAVIAEGEVLQLLTTNNISTSFEEYLKVIESKTAALFAAATEVGAVITEQDQEITEAIKDYGMCLGVAFQIIDDILDYKSNSDILGKEAGDDFKEGKMTLPVLLTLDEGTQAFWHRVIVDKNQKEGDFKQALDYMKEKDAFARSVKIAYDYAEKAKQALQKISSRYPNISDVTLYADLYALVDYVIERDF